MTKDNNWKRWPITIVGFLDCPDFVASSRCFAKEDIQDMALSYSPGATTLTLGTHSHSTKHRHTWYVIPPHSKYVRMHLASVASLAQQLQTKYPTLCLLYYH